MTQSFRPASENRTIEKGSKPRILFLNRAPNESHMNDMKGIFEQTTMGALAETGQADFETLWVGPCVGTKAPELDWLVFKKCLEYGPDVLFVSGWWMHPDDELKSGYPSLFLFYLIRKLLKIKITTLLFDQTTKNFRTSDNLTRFCDVVFTLEHEDYFREYCSFPEKYITTFAIYSPKLFHAGPLDERNIDLTFIGGLGGRYPEERSVGISALRDSGLRVTTPGGRGNDQKKISNDDYGAIVRRSKIIINWCRNISGKYYQAKGRIFETTLAGAMLLCEECDPVNRWFTPFVDYVPFSTTEELVERATYYLRHDSQRLKIAKQGHQTAMSKYRADLAWGQMLRDIEGKSFLGGKSFYREAEAIEGLRRNASSNEVKVAQFFKRELQLYSQFNSSVIETAVGIVEKANRSFVRKLHWSIQRTRWIIGPLKNLPWRILRKLLPHFITRKNVKAVISSLVGKS
jgi:hypothetical protein